MLETTPQSAPQPADAAERLWRLWLRGERPDVDAFLAGAGDLPAAADDENAAHRARPSRSPP